MHQLRRQAGFTLLELMVTITIFGIMLAIGIPNASNWLLANRARGASEFYADGFNMARREAVSHNTASRLVLTANATNGQLDWQVDLCFTGTGTQCLPEQDGWSTTSAAAANDPKGSSGFRSVFRSAASLPTAEVLAPVTLPTGALQVYYTALGWVDTTYDERLTQLRLNPASKYASEVPTVALAVTLAGLVAKCDPTRSAGDSRACPP